MNRELPYIGVTPVQLIWTVVVLIVGWIAAKIISSIFRASLRKTKLPELLAEFLTKLLNVLLIVLVVLLAIGALGLSISSLIVGLSAVFGLILGFGMQDSLTNMGAGFWIALTRPFEKGDVISAAGVTGKVNSVGIMATEFLTPDNTYITVPNKSVWGAPITNYTKMKTRRVDVNIGVAYGTDLDKAIQVAMDLMSKHELIHKESPPAVVITELADSSINLQLRAWTDTGNYWAVKGDLTKGIYNAYNQAGIEIPFPQLDVHLRKE